MLEWGKIGEFGEQNAFCQFTLQVLLFVRSCSYTCSSFVDIVPSNWFGLAHSPIFYPSKIFPYTVTKTTNRFHIIIIQMLLIFQQSFTGIALTQHKMLHKLSSRSHAQFMHTRIKLAGVSVQLIYRLHLHFYLCSCK